MFDFFLRFAVDHGGSDGSSKQGYTERDQYINLLINDNII